MLYTCKCSTMINHAYVYATCFVSVCILQVFPNNIVKKCWLLSFCWTVHMHRPNFSTWICWRSYVVMILCWLPFQRVNLGNQSVYPSDVLFIMRIWFIEVFWGPMIYPSNSCGDMFLRSWTMHPPDGLPPVQMALATRIQVLLGPHPIKCNGPTLVLDLLKPAWHVQFIVFLKPSKR